MTEKTVEYIVHGANSACESGTDAVENLGKCWAAIRNGSAFQILMMRIPREIDHEEYRKRAIDCLSLIGEVKSGELVVRNGKRYFVQRLTHANRGKEPRTPKEYPVFEPRYEAV